MDALLLARLARELDRDWAGARVQGVWEDEARRLVLKLRHRGRSAFLLISPLPESPGFGLVGRRPPCPPRPPALAAYLRAHAEGGRLTGAAASFPDRRVDFRLTGSDGEMALHLEVVGPRSNLVVADGTGMVRAAWRWDGPDRSPLRPVVPGIPYAAPPDPRGLVDPEAVAPEHLVAWLAAGEPLHRRVAGLGPFLAREVAHRAASLGGDEALRSVLAARGGEEPVHVYPDLLSPVPLTHRPEAPALRVDGLAAAGTWLVESLARAVRERDAAREAREARRVRERLERRLAKIRVDLGRVVDPGELRSRADALGASLWKVQPGACRVVVPDPREPGKELTLDLDPTLTPGRNLERAYGKARRAERTREALRRRLAETEGELAGDVPASPAARAAGEGPSRRGEPRAEGPYRRYLSSDGWPIWVGRNGPENDRLLREARPWDLWLHGRDGPGGHVLIRLPGREARVPQRTLTEAAGLAALHSSRAGEEGVEVMVAEASRVHKPKGAAPGRVVVAGERTVRVPPGAGNPRPAKARGREARGRRG